MLQNSWKGCVAEWLEGLCCSHMLKIQKLMIDDFGIEARSNDMLADMSDLASKIGTSESAEND